MVDRQQFDETLRRLITQEPFVPFIVTLNGGQVLKIPDKAVVFCDGAATYLTPDYRMIEFTYEQVASIQLSPEAVS